MSNIEMKKSTTSDATNTINVSINKFYPLIAFVLNAIIFFIVLLSINVIGENNNSIMRGDLFQQYAAFINDFLRSLKGESSFWYSFSNYVGSGSVLTNAYYALNPFNFLFFIAGDNIGACVIVIVIIKLALASATFVYFLQKNVNENNWFHIILGLFYGLSGYSISLHYNIMWLDVIYILPLLIHFIIQFIKTKKYIGLVILYAYMFITNFYVAYMAGIFSALFYIAYLLIYIDFDLKNKMKFALLKSFKFAGTVLLAVGLCAFILFSTFGFLSNHMAQDNYDFMNIRATLFDFLNTFFIGEMPDLDNKVPFLYCGIPAIALLLLFFISNKIEKKIKYSYGALLVFYVLCMIYLPLYKFMHAFDYPNFYGFRFSFVIVFMVLYLGAIAFDKIEIKDIKLFKIFSISAILFYSFMISFQQIAFPGDILNSQNEFIINSFFIVLWYIAFKKMLNVNIDVNISKRSKSIFMVLVMVLCCVELFVNAYLVIGKLNFEACEDNLMNEWYFSHKDAINKIKEKDDSFYRVYVNNEYSLNAGKMFGFNSLDTFSSADNYELRTTLTKLGMSSANRLMIAQCYIPGLLNLFGTKYSLDIPSYDYWGGMNINESNYLPATISENENVLGLGYMVNEKIFDYYFESNSFHNIERLCNYMLDSDEDIFEDISMDDMDTQYINFELQKYDDMYVFLHQSDMVSNSSVIFFYEDDNQNEKFDDNVYMDIFQTNPISDEYSPSVYSGGSGFPAYAATSVGGIYKFKKDEDGIYKIAFAQEDVAPSDFAINNLTFARFNEEAFGKIYNELSKNTLEILENTDDNIIGKVTATEDKNILFTTIPYDKEWHVYVDGVPANRYLVVGDAFLALKLEPGEHIITFTYLEEYSNYGAIVTLISVLIFMCLLLKYVFRKEDKIKVLSSENTDEKNVESDIIEVKNGNVDLINNIKEEEGKSNE